MPDIKQVTMIKGRQVELEADKFGLKIYVDERYEEENIIYIVKDNKIIFEIEAIASCGQNMPSVCLDVTAGSLL